MNKIVIKGHILINGIPLDYIKEVDEQQYNDLIKDCMSISSCGFWEHQKSNYTIIVVMVNDKINEDLIEWFYDEKTISYLKEYKNISEDEIMKIKNKFYSQREEV